MTIVIGRCVWAWAVVNCQRLVVTCSYLQSYIDSHIYLDMGREILYITISLSVVIACDRRHVMTLSESADIIYCQRCATAWKKIDTRSMYYFASATYNIGDHASPAVIFNASENILNCPSCPIEAVDDGMIYPKRKRIDPDGHDSEQASQGDADVAHTGIFGPPASPIHNVADFYPDEDPEDYSVDGYMDLLRATGSVWGTLRDGTVGHIAYSSATYSAIALASHNHGGLWESMVRSWILFKTSEIGSGDIRLASLTLTVKQVGTYGDFFASKAVLVESWPATDTDIVIADRNEIGEVLMSDDQILFSDLSAEDEFTFTLNHAGLSAINAAGITKFGLRTNWDQSNTEPPWQTNGTDSLLVYAADNGSKKPKLTVEWYT